ncbi:MAG: HD domain-containing protein [Myxococcota bacterium]
MINIRDPIHGTLSLSTREIRLVDSQPFQRLRNVKQLGFADLAFPGATHTRYSHSLGAMHVATRLFDVLFPERQESRNHANRPQLAAEDRARFRQAVRLAVLFHDVGHAPLSHTTEMIMPNVSALQIPRATGADRQATHEDYTLKLILDSEVSRLVTQHFGDDGITPQDVADLIEPETRARARWLSGGLDYGPVLHQLVSSELDADRMDYLQRDSFYSGVNYGKFDADWLIQNVVPTQSDSRVHLGVAARAIFSFEDFLLSRYHMFLTVYYHHTPVCFAEMLARYFLDAPGEYALPADVEQYVQHDDTVLWMALRSSKSRWAERIRSRRGFKVLKDDPRYQGNGGGELARKLQEHGIDAMEHTSKGVLSKYFLKADVAPIYVVEENGQTTPVEQYTPLYKRYSEAVRVHRLYVDPARADEAQRILAAG